MTVFRTPREQPLKTGRPDPTGVGVGYVGDWSHSGGCLGKLIGTHVPVRRPRTLSFLFVLDVDVILQSLPRLPVS